MSRLETLLICELCSHPVDTQNDDYVERFWMTDDSQVVRPVVMHELCAAEKADEEFHKFVSFLKSL